MIDLVLSILIILLLTLFGMKYNMYKRPQYSGGNSKSLDNIINKLTQYIKTPVFKETYTKHIKAALSTKDAKPIVTLDDIDTELKYTESTNTYKPNPHIGQRKLFLNEIQLFTNKVPENKNVYCIYAGAAPSNHTGYLAKLFPNIKFILIDPNPFEVREAKPIFLHNKDDPHITHDRAESLIKEAIDGDSQIYIINDLFTVELADTFHKLMKRDEMIFISDIRTNSIDDGFPDVLDILWNLAQQYVWIKKMGPSWSMLKFRHPFYGEDPKIFINNVNKMPYKFDFEESNKLGIDFIENWKLKKLVYFKGEVYIQPWPGRSSTETRLVTDGTVLHDWGSPETYENKLFYYNQISRPWVHHYNPNANEEIGFDYCNDCSLENNIWEEYMKRYPRASKIYPKVIDYVNKLSQITKRNLLRCGHGYRFNNIDIKLLAKHMDEYQKERDKLLGKLDK